MASWKRTTLAGLAGALFLTAGPAAGRAAAPAAPAAAKKPPALEACTLEGGAAARCLTLEVPENRERPEGRRLSLKVAVLEATALPKSPDPVFYVSGGPGQNAVEDGRWLNKELIEVRRRRDLVLVEGRGTAGAHALTCRFPGSPDDPQGYFLDYFPQAVVEQCRRELEQRADLSQYSVATLVADLEAAREALGYKEVNLLAISYGTRIALEYLGRHPEVVRTVALSGAAPPQMKTPLSFAADGQRALDRLIERCAADGDCARAFPDLRGYVAKALAQFDEGPVEVDVGEPGKPEKIRFSRGLFGETLRFLLYRERTARRLPAWLERASRGDFRELALARVSLVESAKTFAWGHFLSVTCTDDVPRIAEAEIAPASVGTFLGDYRVRQQQEACRLWAKPNPKAQGLHPVDSPVPALLMNGRYDPVTPPELARTLVAGLPNSRELVFDAGHVFTFYSCIDPLMARFFESASAKGIVAHCQPPQTSYQFEIP